MKSEIFVITGALRIAYKAPQIAQAMNPLIHTHQNAF